MSNSLVKKDILGVGITDATKDDVLEYVISMMSRKADFSDVRKNKISIVTPNPELIVYASKHQSFKNILNQASVSLCDGVGLYLGAQILGKPLEERITGVDFMKILCEKAAKEGLTTGFLGGRDGVAEMTVECLRENYPGLRVHFTGEEWDVKRFPKQGVDILFVAYGFPKQEQWIHENLPILPVKVAMGVGGAFDYLSGRVIRAPFFMRAIGLEWLFRLIRQPWRIRRQLKLLIFLWLVFKAYTSKSDSKKRSSK